jgi:N-acyl-D-amino-acid deacylase
MLARLLVCLATLAGLVSCAQPPEFDVVIRNGVIYDGSGSEPFQGAIGIVADTIAAVGDIGQARGRIDLDVEGHAISPGFINMLSWATESLLEDGRSQSDIRQGVTLEVFGEGWSMGPLNDEMKSEMSEQQGDITYDIVWTTLGEYLEHLERRGVSTNIASFVGATTVRIHVLGYENRAPNASELESMKELVRQAMEEGALGLGSSLIYAPAFYAKTDELTALARVAAEFDGMYISHMRSEGNGLLGAFDEFSDISRAAGIRSEIYHLKAAGRSNWMKLEAVISRIEDARRSGLSITADMYTYTAGATGLDAAMPPWVQEGGLEQWIERLKDPTVRSRLIKEMLTPTDEWENLYLSSGTPANVLLVGFKTDSLKYLTGKTLEEVAVIRGQSPEETIMDLVIEDGSRVGTVYFLMSEENVRKQIALPWMGFGSDEASLAPEGNFLKSSPHPRAYGNVARLLGKYVREEKIVPLHEAVRRLTSFPAQNLRLPKRGLLMPGFVADVVVFDPESIIDHATFANPHEYSTGVQHVFVNGVQVLIDGEHTGERPGRVVRGPGWSGSR